MKDKKRLKVQPGVPTTFAPRQVNLHPNDEEEQAMKRWRAKEVASQHTSASYPGVFDESTPYLTTQDIEDNEDNALLVHPGDEDTPSSGKKRPPTSTKRYSTTQQAVATQRPRNVIVYQGEYYYQGRPPQTAKHPQKPRATEPQKKGKRTFRIHWLLFVGLAMLLMVGGWISLSLLTGWWQTSQDDMHYGRPRTFQIDSVVGHNDSPTNPSHFIALNFNRHVEIIELPGGDATKAKVYTGPVLMGQGMDLAPVTLSFKDVNGDGKPDMVVAVQDSRFVFLNDNGAFRPPHPDEHISL